MDFNMIKSVVIGSAVGDALGEPEVVEELEENYHDRAKHRRSRRQAAERTKKARLLKITGSRWFGWNLRSIQLASGHFETRPDGAFVWVDNPTPYIQHKKRSGTSKLLKTTTNRTFRRGLNRKINGKNKLYKRAFDIWNVD